MTPRIQQDSLQFHFRFQNILSPLRSHESNISVMKSRHVGAFSIQWNVIFFKFLLEAVCKWYLISLYMLNIFKLD